MKKCFYARAVNILGQEGFMTDLISPTNTYYGFGVVPAAQRFDYSYYYTAPVGLENAPAAPSGREGLEAFPNPFNPAVSAAFFLPSHGRVTVTVLSVDGRIVKTRRMDLGRGRHVERIDLSPYGSGIYLIRVHTGDRRFEKRVVFAK
jgi:hypothetical protein